jgi:hypothetical protein
MIELQTALLHHVSFGFHRDPVPERSFIGISTTHNNDHISVAGWINSSGQQSSHTDRT